MHCSSCNAEVLGTDTFCNVCGHHLADSPKFYPVSMWKFVVLNVATFSLYQIYWFYKNWRFVKDRDDSKIIPWARAIFCVLWYYPLLNEISRHGAGRNMPAGTAASLALAYFALSALSLLPDPYWLIELLSFLPLLPAVARIKAINGPRSWSFQQNSRFRGRNYAVIVVGIALLVFGSASVTNMIPSGTVISGDKLWSKDTRFMRELGMLDAEEPILLFFSDGIFSNAEDGNFLTDRRIVSYMTDDLGFTTYWSARFEEVEELHVNDPGSMSDPSVIMVCANDTEFGFYAGYEKDDLEKMVAAITDRIGPGTPLHRHPFGTEIECQDIDGT